MKVSAHFSFIPCHCTQFVHSESHCLQICFDKELENVNAPHKCSIQIRRLTVAHMFRSLRTHYVSGYRIVRANKAQLRVLVDGKQLSFLICMSKLHSKVSVSYSLAISGRCYLYHIFPSNSSYL